MKFEKLNKELNHLQVTVYDLHKPEDVKKMWEQALKNEEKEVK